MLRAARAVKAREGCMVSPTPLLHGLLLARALARAPRYLHNKAADHMPVGALNLVVDEARVKGRHLFARSG